MTSNEEVSKEASIHFPVCQHEKSSGYPLQTKWNERTAQTASAKMRKIKFLFILGS